MADADWDRMWALFHRARKVAPETRETWLAASCEGDVALRQSIERLLVGHEHAPRFLDRPEALHPWLKTENELVGTAVGAFQIERLIGEGGMGVVYGARQDQPLQRQVALKLIRAGLATREVIARFESERQALAALDHPNIVKVLDAGATDTGRPYFVMELFEGVGITHYGDTQQLTTRQRIELFVPVCRAVHHAHQKGIIHRDLKPSNVVIAEQDGRPVPKVIDFGVARAVDPALRQNTHQTQFGRLVGTLEYMSPEQADMASDVDTRTDVYALGVLLYEMLVGVLPSDSSGLRRGSSQGLKHFLHGEAPTPPSARVSALGTKVGPVAERRRTTPSTLRQALRGDLDWVVMKALEVERDHRYGTASELADDLERHLRDEPVLVGPPGVGYRVSKFVKRHRFGVGAALAALLLLLGFTLVTAWQGVQLRRAVSQGAREARTAEEVTAFLIDLFQTSDPHEARGEIVAVDELLERGAQRIATELEGQPEIQATMLTAIGGIYRNLGLFSEAENVLERSLHLRLETFGENHRDVAYSHHSLAELRQQQGDLAAAETHARRALDLHREAFGSAGPEVARSLLLLGRVLRLTGRFEEAEPVLRESLAVWRLAAPAEDPMATRPLNTLGITLHRRGQLEEAEQHFRQAIEFGGQTWPQSHPETGTFKLNLASVLADLGRDAEAEGLLREALANRRQVYGDDHIEVAVCLNNLARVCQRRGNYTEAEALFRTILDMRDRLGWHDRNEIAVATLNLGVLLRQTGRYVEAEVLYRQGLAAQQRALGPDHPTVAIAHYNLAILLRRLEQLGDAETQMRRAIEIQRGALRDDHWHVARSEAGLGKILIQSGRFEEAEPLLRHAADALRAALPEGHRRVLHAEMYLGQCLFGQGQLEEAESLLRTAHDGLNRDRGPEDESTREAVESLTRLYDAWGRPLELERFHARLEAEASLH